MSSSRDFPVRLGLIAMAAAAAISLAGCEDAGLNSISARANAPVPAETVALMKEKGTTPDAPVLIRTYKKESELEVWKMKADGKYALLKTYPVCRWSGQLGPKTREGDRQVPEGFYSITPAQMKPNSAYYLAFNVGYPNAYDRALGRDGGAIMVHGICSSAGCFSMTDPQIGEIYALVRDGFSGGQREIQMQSYPFRMTAENMAKYRADPNIGFWKQLKEGSDNFEVTKQQVAVGVCSKRYVFNAEPATGRFDPYGPCPQLKQDESVRSEVAAKAARDDVKVAELAAQAKPIRTLYVDGGQHPQFASLSAFASRPEALARGPVDIVIEDAKTKLASDDGKARKTRVSPVVQMAKAAPPSAAPAVKLADAGDVTGSVGGASAKEPDRLAMITGWFGGKKTEPAAAVAAQEPLVPQFADVPTPPQRADASAKPATATSATAGPAAMAQIVRQ
ncbi:ErfK/YbiS/YcfS/YnhG family protein [Methylocella silvestris BL2]|uniref:ErfK/YbiS/YcfS/YnhG family protein n=1 Tax=Methylocella silvestris (strain DSM 15510 / CIP 108128 / LMG 27833 / NCIMB 13906 / BL2) TaxID=395965 RepID=B8EN12_METSB|nr:murein L,D-transpeptidase family protein [Methylocella silvestris]ACK49147.1 ErfK/YbiS/YcfS/YnhG family protein [Methylocella silvestris BL2]